MTDLSVLRRIAGIPEIEEIEEPEEGFFDDFDDMYEEMCNCSYNPYHSCVGCTHRAKIGSRDYCDQQQDFIYDTADGCDRWSPDY
jgi:hypothetical protein